MQIIKLSKYWLFIIAGIVLMPLIIYVAYAAQSYRSDPGTTITVNEHGVCKTVTNSAGSNDLTSTAYSISGGTYQAGYEATKGFDNSATTGLSAVSSASTYVGQNFGAGNAKNIRRVRIHGCAYSYGFNAKLQYSDSGSTWSDTNLASISIPCNNTWSSWLDVNDYGSHQYWRFLDRRTLNYFQAMEIEMVESVIGNSYFIPTNTSAEWEAFRNAVPGLSNVSLGGCATKYVKIGRVANDPECQSALRLSCDTTCGVDCPDVYYDALDHGPVSCDRIGTCIWLQGAPGSQTYCGDYGFCTQGRINYFFNKYKRTAN